MISVDARASLTPRLDAEPTQEFYITELRRFVAGGEEVKGLPTHHPVLLGKPVYSKECDTTTGRVFLEAGIATVACTGCDHEWY